MEIKDILIAVVCTGLLCTASCARRGVPTGGPKDTIPPVLVDVNPALESVNFDGDELVFEFNEFIEARSMKQDKIINPPVKDYDFYTSRRSLVIELNEPLQENTTYTFNLREAVTDATEKNAAKNVILAFSTGSKLDSFQVQGNVTDLMTNRPAEEYLVALYEEGDTLNPFEDPPVYLTKTDDKGNYAISYIRVGTYKLYTYNDKNNNLKIDSNSESLGFEAEPIVLLPDEAALLTLPIDSLVAELPDTATHKTKSKYGQEVDIKTFRQDTRPIIVQSNRPNGKYYEIKTNKPLQGYEINVGTNDVETATLQYLDSLNPDLPKDSVQYLYSNFEDQQKTIRVYNTLKQDSLRTILVLKDSLGQEKVDTMYVQFTESNREAEKLQQTLKAEDKISDSVKIEIKFNKPIIKINSDSILLSYDTLFYLPFNFQEVATWNNSLDQLTIETEINKAEVIDTLLTVIKEQDKLAFEQQLHLQKQYLDSLRMPTDSINQKLRYFEKLASIAPNSIYRQVADSISSLENEKQMNDLLSALMDTLSLDTAFKAVEYNRETVNENLKSLILYLAQGSFISVEQDSSQQIIQRYSFKKPVEFGTITGKVTTAYPKYTIQLLTKNFDLVAETVARNGEYTFELIPPGEYLLRVLVDEDQDGNWETGNILENEEPEPVFFYTEETPISLRANWFREIDLVF